MIQRSKLDKMKFLNLECTNTFKFKIVVLMSFVIPSAGYVLLEKQKRGLMMILWMFFFGYVTYRLAPHGASTVGRFSGAFGVWTLSIVETHNIAKKKWVIK